MCTFLTRSVQCLVFCPKRVRTKAIFQRAKATCALEQLRQKNEELKISRASGEVMSEVDYFRRQYQNMTELAERESQCRCNAQSV